MSIFFIGRFLSEASLKTFVKFVKIFNICPWSYPYFFKVSPITARLSIFVVRFESFFDLVSALYATIDQFFDWWLFEDYSANALSNNCMNIHYGKTLYVANRTHDISNKDSIYPCNKIEDLEVISNWRKDEVLEIFLIIILFWISI